MQYTYAENPRMCISGIGAVFCSLSPSHLAPIHRELPLVFWAVLVFYVSAASYQLLLLIPAVNSLYCGLTSIISCTAQTHKVIIFQSPLKSVWSKYWIFNPYLNIRETLTQVMFYINMSIRLFQQHETPTCQRPEGNWLWQSPTANKTFVKCMSDYSRWWIKFLWLLCARDAQSAFCEGYKRGPFLRAVFSTREPLGVLLKSFPCL